jgi:hypothetical protein
MKNFVLLVNGNEVAVNDFVRRIIINVLLGILGSLTLPESPREAVFRISE